MSSTTPATWITAAAVATLISTLVSGGLAYYWERRKLNRAERSAAYSAFLDAFSQRWRAFSDRDGIVKAARRRATQRAARSTNSDAEQQTADLALADARVSKLRDDLYEAYTRIEILSPQIVVETALRLVRLADDRNRAFKNPERFASPANDARSLALAEFVAQARADLGLKALDTSRLRKDAEQLDAPWWAGGEAES